ncbi:sugar phosphate nucleotidyltransferase [Clostridium magnum]|uniref:Glucose-1-phosphate thymidylyltransferase n=1 Tax=Clostridium magnum DSM 2767 TaxID=1121326 RepID=A0A162U9T1_9CLOT|nr:sugar phosphate nucleotidyltransferase [Clostridium magnum]KZL93680.1 glucose-1-phosphate thymidylyltransferase [Clostridium magnum DSM 2767]SHI92426.1 glucose-1-phosphate thymidylyltransferase [Clostridium magnum DSM 2767]
MKGIVLAGGTGSRLYPLTKATNKHLLAVGKYPMIFHPIAKLKEAGITDILIVTGKEHIGSFVNILGSGYDFGVTFTYKIQDQAGGIAQALSLAENFVNGDKCVVILGDNIFQDNINKFVNDFEKQDNGAKILIQKVPDPQRYGIAEINGDKIIGIEEKPKIPKSNFCVIGIYMYDNRVFNIIKTLQPSARGELEITDVNNWYIVDGSLSYDVLEGWWTDSGTFESLAYVNELSKYVNLDHIIGKKFSS